MYLNVGDRFNAVLEILELPDSENDYEVGISIKGIKVLCTYISATTLYEALEDNATKILKLELEKENLDTRKQEIQNQIDKLKQENDDE